MSKRNKLEARIEEVEVTLREGLDKCLANDQMVADLSHKRLTTLEATINSIEREVRQYGDMSEAYRTKEGLLNEARTAIVQRMQAEDVTVEELVSLTEKLMAISARYM